VDQKFSSQFVKTFTDLQTEYLVDLQCLPDQRSLLMIDVAGVKLWDMERDVPSVSLLRIPQSEPELTTAATHSSLPFAFLVADDAGRCRILDLRQQAEDLTPSIQVATSAFGKHPAIDGSASISSVVFLRDGSGFVTRSFGDLQKWDLRQTERPVATTDVHWFPNRMEFLVNEDFIKDQFKTAITPSGVVVTGMYSADFMAWDPASDKKTKHRAISARTKVPPPEPGRDFTKRVTCVESHPTKPIVAVVSTAALFLFSGNSS
jgi:hypothetical protein